MPPKRNIYGFDAALMIAASQIFDFLELGGKVGYPIAASISASTSWIPFFGQLIGSASLSAASTFDMSLSLPITVLSYCTMSFWFAMKNEEPFSGQYIDKKITLSLVCIVVGAAPLLNALPDITVWTIGNIVFAHRQYKQRLLKYNKEVARAESEILERRNALREELIATKQIQNV